MATVEKILMDLRPLALASVRVPALAVAPTAQGHAPGEPAVSIRVRTAPVFSLPAGSSATYKINNYNGTTSAKDSGMSAAIGSDLTVSPWNQKVQIVKAQGGDARGIPPRGRPV